MYIKQKSCGGGHYGFTIHMHKKTGILKRAIQGTFQPNLLSNGSVVSEEDKFFFHIVFYVKTFFCGVVAILVFQLYRRFLKYLNTLCPAISQKIMAPAITLNFSITNKNLKLCKVQPTCCKSLTNFIA